MKIFLKSFSVIGIVLKMFCCFFSALAFVYVCLPMYVCACGCLKWWVMFIMHTLWMILMFSIYFQHLKLSIVIYILAVLNYVYVKHLRLFLCWVALCCWLQVFMIEQIIQRCRQLPSIVRGMSSVFLRVEVEWFGEWTVPSETQIVKLKEEISYSMSYIAEIQSCLSCVFCLFLAIP